MDYTKKCWYCGQETMEDKGNYCQCSNCGATWNPTPKLGMSVLGGTWSVKDTRNRRVSNHRSPGAGAKVKRGRATSAGAEG